MQALYRLKTIAKWIRPLLRRPPSAQGKANRKNSDEGIWTPSSLTIGSVSHSAEEGASNETDDLASDQALENVNKACMSQAEGVESAGLKLGIAASDAGNVNDPGRNAPGRNRTPCTHATSRDADWDRPVRLPKGPHQNHNGLVRAVTPLYYEGSPEHDYQDWYDYNEGLTRVAIADGVTTSCRPCLLSRILTRLFVQDNYDLSDCPGQQTWWTHARQEWLDEVVPQFAHMQWPEQRLFRLAGARSTFLGVASSTRSSRLQLFGIGDCVAMWFDERERDLVGSKPDIEFDDYPPILSTQRSEIDEGFHVVYEGLPKAPILILASDTIAEYLLKCTPWLNQHRLFSFFETMTLYEFRDWCDGIKAKGLLREDDFTILVVRLNV